MILATQLTNLFNMKYTINWIEADETTTGKKKSTATLTDSDGIDTENVTIWPDFPKYSELQAGREVLGEIQNKDVTKGSRVYHNKTLYPERTNTLGRRPQSGFKAAVVEKNKGIAEAQEKKHDNVKLASTARDATMLVTSFYSDAVDIFPDIPEREEFIRTKITAWRKWLLDNFGDDVPFV